MMMMTVADEMNGKKNVMKKGEKNWKRGWDEEGESFGAQVWAWPVSVGASLESALRQLRCTHTHTRYLGSLISLYSTTAVEYIVQLHAPR